MVALTVYLTDKKMVVKLVVQMAVRKAVKMDVQMAARKAVKMDA